MGVQASLPDSTTGVQLPTWWLLLSGGVWGTLLCLCALLLAQAVADTLPDSLSGMYTVSQAMARLKVSYSNRSSLRRMDESRPDKPSLFPPRQDPAAEDRLRRAIDVVALAAFLAHAVVRRRALFDAARQALARPPEARGGKPIPRGLFGDFSDRREVDEARAKATALLTSAQDSDRCSRLCSLRKPPQHTSLITRPQTADGSRRLGPAAAPFCPQWFLPSPPSSPSRPSPLSAPRTTASASSLRAAGATTSVFITKPTPSSRAVSLQHACSRRFAGGRLSRALRRLLRSEWLDLAAPAAMAYLASGRESSTAGARSAVPPR